MYCKLLFRYLEKYPGFEFQERPRSCLPAGFPYDIDGNGYFLLGYRASERIAEDYLSEVLKETALE